MKSILLFFLIGLPFFGSSQFVTGTAPAQDGTITAAEYYNSNDGANKWFMCWDDTYLYIAKIGGANGEPDILYFDTNPSTSASGGVATGTNGQTTGKSDFGNTPNLPFIAKARVYWTDVYAEISNNSGSGWGVASTANILRTNGTNNREIRIAWAALGGLSARPANFNWLGYANNTGSPAFIYDQYPTANYSGNSTGTPTMYYYQTVDITASSSTTNPFISSRVSYTNYNNTSFLYINTLPTPLFDFTLGKSTSVGSTAINSDITIGRDLVVENGTLNSQSGSTKTIQMTNSNGGLYIFTTAGGHIYGTDNGVGNDLGLQINSGAFITVGGNPSGGGAATDDHKFLNVTVQSNSTLALSNGISCKYGTFPVSGSIQINANGYIEGSLVNNKSANYSGTSNLIFNNGGIYTSTNFEWPLTNSPANVTIQNIGTNVTMNGAKSLTGVLTINAGTTLNMNAQSFTLRSTATGTARIAPILGTLSGASNVTVERFIPASTTRAWRLLSVPTITSNTINGAWQNGQAAGVAGQAGAGTWITGGNSDPSFDGQVGAGSMLTYNQSTNTYTTVPNTTMSIATDKGYMLYVRGDRTATHLNPTINLTTLRTTGTIKMGNYPVTPIAVAAGKYEIIGNPYPSEIDFRNVARGTGIDATFYIWDPKLIGSTLYGGYQTCTFNGSNYLITPGGGSYGASSSINNLIQSGQAFFVHATTAATNAVSFTEASKSNGSSNIGFNPTVSGESLVANVYAVNGGVNSLADGIMVNYDNTYSSAVDQNDAMKLDNFGMNLSIARSGSMLAVEKRQVILSRDTVFLNLSNVQQQQYQFELIGSNLNHPGMFGFLQDSYLNTATSINLNGTTTVNFTIDGNAGSSVPNRFRIVFGPASPLAVSFVNVKALVQGTNVNVQWSVENERGMKQYEVERSADGISFSRFIITPATNNSSANYNTLDQNAVAGYNYYRIKSVGLNGEIGYSVVVRVLIGQGKQGIIIYPNPIVDGRVNVQMNNMPGGNYQVRLLNNAGQVVFSKQMQHAEGSSTENLLLSSSLSKGIYQLEFTKPDNHKVAFTVKY